MIENVLAGSGISMEYAPNGLEALKKATDLRPQVMIVDVGLTGIYGFELCERLKSDPGTQNIKIVLLSSVYGLTAYKRSPVTLYGADDYIEKHHIPDKLLPKVRTLLEGGAPNAADRSAAPAVQQPAAGQQPAKPSPQTSAPLISMRGIVRVSSNPAVQQAPQNRPAPYSQPSVSSAPAQAPSLSLPACGPSGRRRSVDLKRGSPSLDDQREGQGVVSSE